ncbi:MAG TPA: aconitase family protein, partial [Candidatus Limnocylindria bacterium]|nr:aconitase family protein [Candidatus Limnocylindria bacterium]
FTGVPAAVDLAAMRSAMQRAGKDPARIEPLIPIDLIIDHSVQADFFGSKDVYERNLQREYERNRERYSVLRWAGQAFKSFRVVPPGSGICHQVNLERLCQVVQLRDGVAMPDTLFGADSHTTMVNGLGVLGWGVGGIEAEAAMLGQPTYLPWPVVVGVRLIGTLPAGTTATDLVLTLTEKVRKHGVVDKFVEFFGDGLATLTVQDRATVSNMCPEYGATASYFPVDEQSLRYLRITGRGAIVDLVERYTRAQGLFRLAGAPAPAFDEVMELDLATVRPSIAGPKRPQDRVELPQVWASFLGPKPVVKKSDSSEGPKPLQDAPTTNNTMAASVATATVAHRDPHAGGVTDGSVVIAAITSCTNTSNPSVMIAAGLLAKKAVERGLGVRPHVKTTLAPGSRVVTRYLDKAGLTPYLEKLGYFLVGYGCTVCIAEGAAVLMSNGMARRIEDLPLMGGATVYAPTSERTLAHARQALAMAKGDRDCVTLTLQDGRTITCTPDHELLRSDGEWVRADRLSVGRDRVVMGLDAPLDEVDADERGWTLRSASFDFDLSTPWERQRTLAFARLLGHLLDDGSIDTFGQARMNAGQALDRKAIIDDIEIVTGKRPAGSMYDERKWAIVLPQELSEAIIGLGGVRVGRRIDQEPRLPDFILDSRCPVAVLREFLGGMFGADGHGPVLNRMSDDERTATLEQPAYSHAVRPEHVAQQRLVMDQICMLLDRCGVDAADAHVREYPVRRSESSYPAAQDGGPRIEVRLELPNGLSFVTKVGFRYCVDKALRASAAAVYWRTIDSIAEQRLWMMDRLLRLHADQPELSFAAARRLASSELAQRETVVFPHYSTLQGSDRFDRLIAPQRGFRPLHRDAAGFPSPVEVLRDIGAREWFALLKPRESADFTKRYCVGKDATELPTFTLKVIDRREAGPRQVFDLSIDDHHAFIADGVCVSNCIGQTGPLATPEIEQEVKEKDLNVVSVLSGNRNFEGRIHPLVKSSYLASPPLVIAYALAGTVHIDLADQPIADDKNGKPVFLKDIWPSLEEVSAVMDSAISEDMYTTEYGKIFEGDEHWRAMPSPTGAMFQWDDSSTYVHEPPFFKDIGEVRDVADIENARVLVMVGDSVTTDHISPAGAIPAASPAGQYLQSVGVKPVDFNQYGTRRGNHEVLVRGTFANIRLRNLLVEREGWWTRYLPSGEEMPIYDASMRYQREGTPLVVIAGKEYGTGSSRDWAAKGPLLLGVRAVIAETFERIHRSNLVGMGILPLQFEPGQNAGTLGLTGVETFTIRGLARLAPRATIEVEARRANGEVVRFKAIARVDDPVDIDYLRHGGVLPLVFRELAARA